jgi:hypothetical protein
MQELIRVDQKKRVTLQEEVSPEQIEITAPLAQDSAPEIDIQPIPSQGFPLKLNSPNTAPDLGQIPETHQEDTPPSLINISGDS